MTAICSAILGAFSGAARRAIEPGPCVGEETSSGPCGPRTTTSLLSKVLTKARPSPKLSREAGLKCTFSLSLDASHMCLQTSCERTFVAACKLKGRSCCSRHHVPVHFKAEQSSMLSNTHHACTCGDQSGRWGRLCPPFQPPQPSSRRWLPTDCCCCSRRTLRWPSLCVQPDWGAGLGRTWTWCTEHWLGWLSPGARLGRQRSEACHCTGLWQHSEWWPQSQWWKTGSPPSSAASHTCFRPQSSTTI